MISDSGIAAIRTELGPSAAQAVEIDLVNMIIKAALEYATDVPEENIAECLARRFPHNALSTTAQILAYVFADEAGLGVGDVYTVCGFDSRIDALFKVKRTASTLYYKSLDSHAMLATLDFIAILGEK